MDNRSRFGMVRTTLLGLALAGLLSFPLTAREKLGMPDLSQEDQTCLPTSTANLIIWFGEHGYPKLLQSGATDEERELHTVHVIMSATDASYELGTRTDAITYGIEKYIHDAGYGCNVEYRGIDWSQAHYAEVVADPEGEKYRKGTTGGAPAAFSQDWLKENDEPNKGFILLLAYCTFDRGSNTFSYAINAGHAVTLVNAQPDMILIHDPAHDNDEPGRKILTPEVLSGGTFHLPGYNAPVAGLMLLSGSLLEAPPDAGVMLTGAVCITMHPEPGQGSPPSASPANGPTAVVTGSGGNGSPAPSTAPATTPVSSPTSSSWAVWLFNLLFKK